MSSQAAPATVEKRYFWLNHRSRKVVTKGFTGKKAYSMGTRPECTLRIKAEGTIAEKHCELIPRDGKLFIVAIDAPIWLNKNEIKPNSGMREIRPGDVLRLADRAIMTLIYEDANATTGVILDPDSAVARYAPPKKSAAPAPAASTTTALTTSTGSQDSEAKMSMSAVSSDLGSDQALVSDSNHFTDGPFHLVDAAPFVSSQQNASSPKSGKSSPTRPSSPTRSRRGAGADNDAELSEVALMRVDSHKRIVTEETNAKSDGRASSPERPSSPRRLRTQSPVASDNEAARSSSRPASPTRRPPSPRRQATESASNPLVVAELASEEPKQEHFEHRSPPRSPSRSTRQSKTLVHEKSEENDNAEGEPAGDLKNESEDDDSDRTSRRKLWEEQRHVRGKGGKVLHELPYGWEAPTSPRRKSVEPKEEPKQKAQTKKAESQPKRSSAPRPRKSPAPSPSAPAASSSRSTRTKDTLGNEAMDVDESEDEEEKIGQASKAVVESLEALGHKVVTEWTKDTPSDALYHKHLPLKPKRESVKPKPFILDSFDPKPKPKSPASGSKSRGRPRNDSDAVTAESEDDEDGAKKELRSPSKKRKAPTAAEDTEEPAAKRAKEQETEDAGSGEPSFLPWKRLKRAEQQKRTSEFESHFSAAEIAVTAPLEVVKQIFVRMERPQADEDEIVALTKQHFTKQLIVSCLVSLVEQNYLRFEESTATYHLTQSL